MVPLRIAVLGCGFWSRFQIPAWLELSGIRLIAVCDTNIEKAEATAKRFGIPAVYSDPLDLVSKEKPDLLDIITSPETHHELVHLAARCRTPVVCQKPLANDFETATEMVDTCRKAGVPFFVHENWRWQRPMRALKRVLDSRAVGKPFRARLDFNCSFPVFENQPFLREQEKFILLDVGSHLLDVTRFLFGEADRLYCQTSRIHPDIRGEDVATVLLRMTEGATVNCNLSFASRTEMERFTETFLLIEAERGSVELGPDFWLRVTTDQGTHARRYPPPAYSWVDPSYALPQTSIVECHRNLLDGLRGDAVAETTAEDNIRTLKLVFACYESARTGQVVQV
jgi:D-apiose dehydrogenase